MGRLLVALRNSVQSRAFQPDADPKFKTLAEGLRSRGLTREEASGWIKEVGEREISPQQLQRLESAKRFQTPQLGPILKAYGLSPDEIQFVLRDPHLNAEGAANPHLLAPRIPLTLLLGEFGPAALEALEVAGHRSTWVEVEKASSGGFQQDELVFRVSDAEVDPPRMFVKRANDAARQNEAKLAAGIRGWSDNRTLCLRGITSKLADDTEERNQVQLHAVQSRYRFNVAAKQQVGASMRWAALQDAAIPLTPVDYLASGIGVTLNVLCDGGRSMVIGQRSEDETFRKGEYDVAVVEGIRQASDEKQGFVDVIAVALRALNEELGISCEQEDIGSGGPIDRIVPFEVGCDLEFYQWNILAFVETRLAFDEIRRLWHKCKDRKENSRLLQIPNEPEAVKRFMVGQPVWSCGVACALRTFDYRHHD